MSPILGLLLLSGPTSHLVDPAPSGRWARSTRELAADLLPPEMASDATRHEVERPIVEGGPPYSVNFFGRPTPTGDGNCTRNNYRVSTGNLNDGPKALKSTHIRLGPCPDEDDAIFAHVNAPGNTGDAFRALQWLAWAKSVASSGKALPFQLECRSEITPDPCAKGGRSALATLPVQNAYIVERPFDGKRGEWRFAITERMPVESLWEVKVESSGDMPAIRMLRKVPAPF